MMRIRTGWLRADEYDFRYRVVSLMGSMGAGAVVGTGNGFHSPGPTPWSMKGACVDTMLDRSRLSEAIRPVPHEYSIPHHLPDPVNMLTDPADDETTEVSTPHVLSLPNQLPVDTLSLPVETTAAPTEPADG